jgi:murein DD-endopeptidase
MIHFIIKTITILAFLMMPVAAIAQTEPHHDTRITIPVHEITGSYDLLRVEARVISEPVPFKAMDITILAYELRIANYDRETIRLDELEVFTDDYGIQLIGSYSTDELAGMWANISPVMEEDGMHLMSSGSFDVLYLWHEIPQGDPVPELLIHRLTFLASDGEDQRIVSIVMKPVTVPNETPVVIGSPLRGGPWISWDGPSNQSRHRRTLAPRDGQLSLSNRFAIDWSSVRGDNPETFEPDTAGTQGAEILAVADGRVVKVTDGIPDNPLSQPGARAVPITWETIAGNVVILDIGNGNYVHYGHLLEGSIPVKPGDHVRHGDVIGLIGNSGNSEGPHLHFEVTDSDILGRGRGLPFVFEEFELLAEIGFGPGWRERTRIPDQQERIRKLEIPLDRWLIRFPE